MAAFTTMLQALSDSITAATSLQQSSVVIDARTVPNAQTNGSFCLDIQTTNTGKSRDRTSLYLEHDLKVNILWRKKMNSQFESLKEALDIDITVIDALLDQSSVAAYSVFYVSSQRTQLPSQEYILIEITFKVSQSLVITS